MAFNQKELDLIKWGVSNGKSKEEITQALGNLRTGVIPKPVEVAKPSTFERIKTGIQEKGAKVQEQIAGEGEFANKNALERGIGATATGFSALSGTLYNALPEDARNTLDVVGGGIGKGFKYLTDKIANSKALQDAVGRQVVNADGTVSFVPNEEGIKQLESALKITSDLGLISGEILGADQASKALTKGATMVEQGAVKAKEIAVQGSDLAKEQIKKVLPKSEDIMTKVARITPKEAQTFQKMTGKSTGEYLSQKGNFNAPEDIVKVEAETFAKTLADKEATLAQLPGTYKSGVVDDVLSSLKKKAVETSTKNVKAPYLKQVDAWIKKAKTTGLTMEEINQVKKLFEREVKLGYNTLTDATKVKQATYLDDALRAFQDKTASDLGFTNIKDLSKQIQASKFIVDKLGNKIVSNDLLNGVSLTDYIILAGGEPASVGAFLTKKLFSSKTLQAKLAKTLYKGEVKPPIEANYSPQATKATQTNNSIKNIIPKSSPKSASKSSLKGKGVTPETNLINEAKKYKSAEEFVKAQGTPVYHASKNIIKEFGDVPNNGTRFYGKGTYFSKSIDRIKEFGDNIIEARLNLKTPYTEGDAYNKPMQDQIIKLFGKKQGQQIIDSRIILDATKVNGEKLAEMYKKAGYDGIIARGGNDIAVFNPKEIVKTKSQLTEIWNKANKPKTDQTFLKISNPKPDPLVQEAKKYKSAEEFVKAQVTPKTIQVWNKSKFSNDGAFADIPVIRKEENITLYHGGEQGQFWTPNKKYAEQFGNVTEKTGTFYKVDNGNRVTDVYVEAPTKSQLEEIWKKANSKVNKK